MCYCNMNLAVGRRLLGGAAFLGLLAGVFSHGLAAEPSNSTKKRPPATKERIEAQKIDQVLAKPITVEFDETPFSDVVAFLRDATGLAIHVKRQKLQDVGAWDAPVTVQLKDTPLETVLRLVLDEVPATYTIEKDLIILGPKSDAADLEVRVYNVRDLLKDGDWDQTGDVAELIRLHVQPNDWDSTGGIGAVNAFNGLVVVTQTSGVQKKVDQLLQAMRTAFKEQ